MSNVGLDHNSLSIMGVVVHIGMGLHRGMSGWRSYDQAIEMVLLAFAICTGCYTCVTHIATMAGQFDI